MNAAPETFKIFRDHLSLRVDDRTILGIRWQRIRASVVPAGIPVMKGSTLKFLNRDGSQTVTVTHVDLTQAHPGKLVSFMIEPFFQGDELLQRLIECENGKRGGLILAHEEVLRIVEMIRERGREDGAVEVCKKLVQRCIDPEKFQGLDVGELQDLLVEAGILRERTQDEIERCRDTDRCACAENFPDGSGLPCFEPAKEFRS